MVQNLKQQTRETTRKTEEAPEETIETLISHKLEFLSSKDHVNMIKLTLSKAKVTKYRSKISISCQW